MDTSLLPLQSRLQNTGILISFSGRFSQGIIEELGDAIKKHMEADDRPKNDIYNVFAIFIEQTQNIKNYSITKQSYDYYESIVSSGIVCIGKNESGYFIWSGNLMHNSDTPALLQRLEGLNDVDKLELKKRYKEQLKKNVSFESIGAGLGLIDIARKATLPLEYSISRLDEEFSFYELKVMV